MCYVLFSNNIIISGTSGSVISKCITSGSNNTIAFDVYNGGADGFSPNIIFKITNNGTRQYSSNDINTATMQLINKPSNIIYCLFIIASTDWVTNNFISFLEGFTVVLVRLSLRSFINDFNLECWYLYSWIPIALDQISCIMDKSSMISSLPIEPIFLNFSTTMYGLCKISSHPFH